MINLHASGSQGVYITSSGGAVVKNNTIYGNILSGGGVIFYAITIPASADPATIVENNIIYKNDVGISNSLAADIARYNDVYDHRYGDYEGTYNTAGTGDISLHPKFVYPAAGDFRLKGSSPCIDAGNPGDDFNAEPLPNGGRINMGSYGGTRHATQSGINPTIYVSENGNDSNDGSISAPLRNIQTAMMRAMGDTIKVAAGVYSEGLIATSSMVLRGGYTEDFREEERDIFNNKSVVQAISSVMLLDQYGANIDGMVFDGNGVAGTGLDLQAAARVTHTVIYDIGNPAGSAVIIEANAIFINNTLYDNSMGLEIGSDATGAVIKNNILVEQSFAINNGAKDGITAYNCLYNNSFNYIGFYDSPGIGDIALDPKFSDAAAYDFSLQDGSPCIDRGDPDPIYNDPDGTRNDMGAYFYLAIPQAPLSLIASGSSPSPWQNDSDFLIDWTNPAHPIRLTRAYYKLGSQPENNSDTTATAASDPPINITATAEGVQPLFIWLRDSLGSYSHNNHAFVDLRYDATKPLGTSATSPDTSKAFSFMVSWLGGSDSGGSGLSGFYNIRVRDNSGSWTDWLTDYMGTSAEYNSGEHGHIYFFEAVAQDNAGNTEDFTEVAECSTFVDTSIVDNEAPASPLNLTASGSSPSPWQNTPQFLIDWDNPEDETGISCAYYKRNYTPSGNTDTTGSVAGIPPFQILASQEGGQDLFVWLVDGKGNVDYRNNTKVLLRFDATKPFGTMASSPDTSAATSFTVNWAGGSDDGGSGLSGYYDIRVKEEGGTWTDWKTNYSGQSAQFQGEHNRIYHFEAAARDSAANIEDFSGTAETITVVDTTSDIDIFPPEKPVGLNANPGQWSNSNNFSVTWSNPPGDELISGVYYKIGSIPISDKDGTFISGNLNQISNIQAPAEGEYYVFVWLQDLTGNHSHSNAAYTTVKYDVTEPIIEHTPVISSQIATTISIFANAQDNLSDLKKFKLFYRMTGDIAGFDSTDFSVTQANIPSDMNTQRGVEYFIFAMDNATNKIKKPELGFYAIQAILNAGQGSQPFALHQGARVVDYRIFSVPLILDDKKPAVVFEDDLGSYDAEKWKLFDVVGGVLRDYNTIKELNIIEPGKGFLLLVNSADKYIDVESSQSPKTSDYNKIQLDTGWNLIGNPFDFDIPLDSLNLNGEVPQAWYLNASGWVNNPTHLRRWEGLAIFTENNAELNIGVGSGSGYNFSIQDYFVDEAWGIKIMAQSENGMDVDNYAGVYSENDSNISPIWYEPPRIGDALTVYINPDEQLMKTQTPQYSKLSTFLKLNDEKGHYWDFVVSSNNIDERIDLLFEAIGNMPEQFDKQLLDKDLKMAYDLSHIQWHLTIRNNVKTRKFRLLVGTSEFISSKVLDLAIIPKSYELRQNFPNPFNPNTFIIFTLPVDERVRFEIYNLLGQKIKTLINDEVYNSGYHMVQWDGLNENGREAATGIYLFRCSAGDFMKVKKGILIR
jgi:hypothetical protein